MQMFIFSNKLFHVEMVSRSWLRDKGEFTQLYMIVNLHIPYTHLPLVSLKRRLTAGAWPYRVLQSVISVHVDILGVSLRFKPYWMFQIYKKVIKGHEELTSCSSLIPVSVARCIM